MGKLFIKLIFSLFLILILFLLISFNTLPKPISTELNKFIFKNDTLYTFFNNIGKNNYYSQTGGFEYIQLNEDEKIKWKVYNDDSNSFSFKYPPNWIIFSEKPSRNEYDLITIIFRTENYQDSFHKYKHRIIRGGKIVLHVNAIRISYIGNVYATSPPEAIYYNLEFGDNSGEYAITPDGFLVNILKGNKRYQFTLNTSPYDKDFLSKQFFKVVSSINIY